MGFAAPYIEPNTAGDYILRIVRFLEFGVFILVSLLKLVILRGLYPGHGFFTRYYSLFEPLTIVGFIVMTMFQIGNSYFKSTGNPIHYFFMVA